MQDRVPANPGRVKITPESGSAYYAIIERADNPTQTGTPLNKANLLTDATASAIAAATGLSAPSTPNEALGSLGAAMDSVMAQRLRVTTGTYTGDGTYGSANPRSLTFDFPPLLLLIQRRGAAVEEAAYYNLLLMLPTLSNSYSVYGYGGSSYKNGVLSLSGSTVSWYSTINAHLMGNTTDKTFDYLALGLAA